MKNNQPTHRMNCDYKFWFAPRGMNPAFGHSIAVAKGAPVYQSEPGPSGQFFYLDRGDVETTSPRYGGSAFDWDTQYSYLCVPPELVERIP